MHNNIFSSFGLQACWQTWRVWDLREFLWLGDFLLNQIYPSFILVHGLWHPSNALAYATGYISAHNRDCMCISLPFQELSFELLLLRRRKPHVRVRTSRLALQCGSSHSRIVKQGHADDRSTCVKLAWTEFKGQVEQTYRWWMWTVFSTGDWFEGGCISLVTGDAHPCLSRLTYPCRWRRAQFLLTSRSNCGSARACWAVPFAHGRKVYRISMYVWRRFVRRVSIRHVFRCMIPCGLKSLANGVSACFFSYDAWTCWVGPFW